MEGDKEEPMRLAAVVLAVLFSSCGGGLPPIDPPEPPEPEPCTVGSCERNTEDPRMCVEGDCVPCEPNLEDAIWNTDAGEITCSTEERPVKHWPPDSECPVLTDPCEVPPELPQPQCPRFTDRGGTERCQSGACDCYCEEEWVACEPSSTTCPAGFPQGVPNEDFTMGPVMRAYAPTVNTAMRTLTGCDIGTDCRTNMEPDEWMHAVIDLVQRTGLCAGRHIDTTPGGTDEIAVTADCSGWWEGYKIYNYGGGKVIWSPNADRPAWKIDPKHCDGGGTEPPPAGDCPQPHPDVSKMQFKCREHNGILDCTWVTVNQPDFCASIGYCCMPGSPCNCNECGAAGCTPRGGCPVRGDGNPERPVCEAELCSQKWECNGEPYPPYKGNPAQSNCRGHWKTWCENAPTEAEGNR
jgi:hypothetical protein